MNKKTLGDIKINNDKIQPVVKNETLIKEVSSPSSVSNVLNTSNTISVITSDKTKSKYEFLDKLNKKTTPFPKRIPQTPHISTGRPFNKFILFFFIVSLLVGAFYLLSTVFFMAKVTVISRNQSYDLLKEDFKAEKNKAGSVPFEVMIVDDIEVKDVILTASSEVSEKAKGEITIYNEYSTKPVKIIASSFVSDEKGKTYKTDSAISIPGYTTDKTKIIPGEISVGITAFLPGDSYNGNPESFSVNGFKGTPKFKKIYGKIKTPLTGGSTGLVYTLDEKEKELYTTNSKIFKDKLMRKLVAQVPSGYILYPDATNFNYGLGDNVSSKVPNAKIEMKGTLSAILLKENELSDVIIDKILPDISIKEKTEIVKPDLSSLSFKFVNKDQVINKDIENFDFELNGTIPILWKPDVIALKGLLVNKSKIEVPGIFKQDPGISSASVKIFPFWSKVLPEKDKNINIILK